MDLQLQRAVRRYRVIVLVVGTLLLLLVAVGMPLQLAAGQPGMVNVLGPVHGLLYLVYLAAAADLARHRRFTFWQVVAVVVAGFVPFLAFVVERRVVARSTPTHDAGAMMPTGR